MRLLLTLILAQGILVPPGETGGISGVLRTPAGAPAVGIRVAATAAPNPADPQSAGAALVSLTETDKDGRYLLENIPPGRYYITAGRLDVPTYYPGVLDVDKGTVVTISARQKLEGLNFTLQDSSSGRGTFGTVFLFSSPGYNIPLRISVEGGGKVPVIAGTTYPHIRLIPSTSGAVREFLFDTTSISLPMPSAASPNEYRVEVKDLPSGYAIRSMTYGKGADAIDLTRGTLKISLQGASLTQGLALNLISGPASAAMSNNELSLVLAHSPGASQPSGVRVTGVSTTGVGDVYLSGKPGNLYADGSFEFLGVTAGRHTLVKYMGSATSAQGTVLVAGDRDVDRVTLRVVYLLPQDIELDAPRPAGNRAPGVLEFPSISGRVIDAGSGNPLAEGGAVTLIGYRNVRRAYALDGNGEFRATDLLPGMYKVELRLFGYQEETHTVMVDEGETQIAFRLRRTP